MRLGPGCNDRGHRRIDVAVLQSGVFSLPRPTQRRRRVIERPQRLQNIVARRLRSVPYDRLAEPGKVDGYRPKPGVRQPVKVLAPH